MATPLSLQTMKKSQNASFEKLNQNEGP